jgi:hypothetical protein
MISSRKTLMCLSLAAMTAASSGAMAQQSVSSPLMLAASGPGAMGTHGVNNASNPNRRNNVGVDTGGAGTTNPALRPGTASGSSSSSSPSSGGTSDSLQQQRQQSGERMIMERKGQIQEAN